MERDQKGRFVAGHKVSKKWIQKWKENHKGYHFSPKTEFKKGCSGGMGMLGKHHTTTEKTKNKISKANKGRKFSEETKRKMSIAHKGIRHIMSEKTKNKISKARKGMKFSKETKEKLSKARKGKKQSEETKEKISASLQGVSIEEWMGFKEKQERNDPAYRQWRLMVFKRDGYKCKMNNKDCSGKIEAHHILGWSEYPELRYKINNGITLCHAHHPMGRAKEKRLIPFFQGLVSVSS